jgi:hypothetical protein
MEDGTAINVPFSNKRGLFKTNKPLPLPMPHYDVKKHIMLGNMIQFCYIVLQIERIIV